MCLLTQPVRTEQFREFRPKWSGGADFSWRGEDYNEYLSSVTLMGYFFELRWAVVVFVLVGHVELVT